MTSKQHFCICVPLPHITMIYFEFDPQLAKINSSRWQNAFWHDILHNISVYILIYIHVYIPQSGKRKSPSKMCAICPMEYVYGLICFVLLLWNHFLWIRQIHLLTFFRIAPRCKFRKDIDKTDCHLTTTHTTQHKSCIFCLLCVVYINLCTFICKWREWNYCYVINHKPSNLL